MMEIISSNALTDPTDSKEYFSSAKSEPYIS